MTMFRYFVLACLLALFDFTQGNAIRNEVLNDKELLLAFVVNRHGERTPDEDELSLSDVQDKLRNLTYLEGLEGLTNVGKRRAYQIGKFIRQRYGSQDNRLISNYYLQDEIAIRSTDKERTKMTALVAMAAAYPPEVDQQWDEGLGKVWQPVPYTAVPLTEDYLRYYSNCKRFKTLMAKAKEESINTEFLPYKDLIIKIKEETGRNFTENPLMFQTLFDLYKSQVSLGLDIPEWAKPLLPKLSETAKLAYNMYFRNDEMKKIGGGVMLDNFIKAASDIALGKPVIKRLRLFSAHDFNIGALMHVTRVVKEPSIPEYGSMFALELYKSRSSGEFSVLPIYLTKAGESSAHAYQFEGCEDSAYCEFGRFKDLTKQFLLPEREYYNICGISTEM